jgi:ubiquinol-cytochrome c reductase cytochrome b subunit
VPNPFFPGVLLPGLTFGGLYAWPFLEARFTKDRRPHHLLNLPRDAPVRTAIGAAALAFYTVLFFAGANDILAVQFHVAPESITNAFRVLVFVLPAIVFLVTRKVCRDLRRGGSHPTKLPVGSHVQRTATGGYEEIEPDGQASGVPGRDRG